MKSLFLVLALALTGCRNKDADTDVVNVDLPVHPSLAARPEHRDVVLSRLDRAPYLTIYDTLLANADRDYEVPDLEEWDHGAHGTNGEIAHSNAFLAWLHDDEVRAAKAIEGFELLDDDFESNTTWDVNIRMPHSLMGYTDAWDFLLATPYWSQEQADEAQAKITTINRGFYERYLENEFYRSLVMGPSQNNHPIRSACAIGYVAMAFPDDPDADKWANWAFSELDYLWGPNGQYVQPDGGVSEGPFYFGFAWGVSTACFIAAENTGLSERTLERDCRNRQDVDPWAGHGCVEGEPFQFENPLRLARYQATVDWSMSLRLPSGQRAPLGDAYFNPFNGGALLTSFGGGGHYRWDWETNDERPYEMGHGADLVTHHLLYLDDSVAPTEPPWTTRFLPDAGNAVFRSDWSEDARWLLLVAEAGGMRKTLHDHVDGLSFSMAAYGEYLLLDPGYYKPNDLANAVTSAAEAHNVLLIDGEGAPDKGLLTDFGDVDAFLRNTHDGAHLDYAEAHQSYQQTQIERSVISVDGRYFVVADRLTTTATVPRSHTFRLNGYAGYTSGGLFSLRPDGALWQRDLAGVDVFLAATQPGLSVVEPAYRENEVPHVHEFSLDREVVDHGVMDGVVTGLAPRFLAVLAPFRVGDTGDTGPMAVSAVPLGEGVAAWRMDTEGGTDWVILREVGGDVVFGLPDGRDLQTDAELTLLRDDGALIVRGSYLSVDGVFTIDGADPAAFAVVE